MRRRLLRGMAAEIVAASIILAIVFFLLQRCPGYCYAGYCGFPPRECIGCYGLGILELVLPTAVVLTVAGIVAGHYYPGARHGSEEEFLGEEEEFFYPSPT